MSLNQNGGMADVCKPLLRPANHLLFLCVCMCVCFCNAVKETAGEQKTVAGGNMSSYNTQYGGERKKKKRWRWVGRWIVLLSPDEKKNFAKLPWWFEVDKWLWRGLSLKQTDLECSDEVLPAWWKPQISLLYKRKERKGLMLLLQPDLECVCITN